MIVVSEHMKQLYRDALHKMELDAAAMELFEMKRSLQTDLAQRAEEAAKEQKDVDRLEGHSIKGLFLGLTGKKEEVLKRERQEALEARIHQEIAVAELSSVANKLEHILDQREKLGNALEEFWAKFPEIYTAFQQSGPEDPATVRDLELQMITAAKQLKEVQEAYDRGIAGRRSIEAVLKSLKDVRSSEDEALAPGSAAVRKKIELAQQEVLELKEQLCGFKEELLDLCMPAELRFDVHEILQLRDDCLTGRTNSTNISDAYNRISVILHPAIQQMDAILPYLDAEIEKWEFQLQETRLSLATYVLQEIGEI